MGIKLLHLVTERGKSQLALFKLWIIPRTSWAENCWVSLYTHAWRASEVRWDVLLRRKEREVEERGNF